MTLIELVQLHMIPALLVIFRIGGLMVFAPIFGSAVIPIRIRVFLSFLLGIVAYPLLVESGLEVPTRMPSLWGIVPLAGMEITLGAGIGFLASIPLLAAQAGGLVMGQQMGLGFAQFFNPAVDDQADVVGQMVYLLAVGGFILVGGVEATVAAVLHSFEYVPLGGFVADLSLLELMSGLMLAAFEFALRIAAPLLALVFLETIAMGFVAKTVPQLNILSLGFPLRILLGFFIIAAGLVVIDSVLMEAIEAGMNAIYTWIELQ